MPVSLQRPHINSNRLWSVADQGLSSLTNVGIGLVVASRVPARTFGAFSVGFLTYLAALSISTAFVSEPMIVAGRGGRDETDYKGAAGASLHLALMAGVIVAAVSQLLPRDLATLLRLVALLLPGLLLHDYLRHYHFGRGAASRAAELDLAWVLLLASGLLIDFIATPQASAVRLTAIWGGAAGAAAAYGLFRARLFPSISGGTGWLVHHSGLAAGFAGDSMLSILAAHGGVYVVGATVGLEGIAALRGAALLMGPYRVLVSAARLVALPEWTRIRSRGDSARAATLALGGTLLALGFVWSVAVIAAPGVVGRTLLGDSWEGAREILPFACIAIVAGALAGPPLYALRVYHRPALLMKTRLGDSFLTVVGMSGGAHYGGISGAAVGWAMANSISLALWWSAASRAMGDPRNSPALDEHSPEVWP